jgi:hypothetical protein
MLATWLSLILKCFSVYIALYTLKNVVANVISILIRMFMHEFSLLDGYFDFFKY